MQDECINTIYLVLEDLESAVAMRDKYLHDLKILDTVKENNVFKIPDIAYKKLFEKIQDIQTKVNQYNSLYNQLTDEEKDTYELLKLMKKNEVDDG